MGFPIITMSCTRCGRTEPGIRYSRPRKYQVDDETQLAMHYHYGWCFDCDGARHIENLCPDNAIAAIRRAGATLKSATPRRRLLRTGWDCQSYHWLDEGLDAIREFRTKDWHALGNALETQASRLVFLAQRTVPARCLQCEGHNVTGLERFNKGDMEMAIHPGCGGDFIIKISGSINMAPSTTKLIHHPDGRFSHEEPYEASSLDLPGKLD